MKDGWNFSTCLWILSSVQIRDGIYALWKPHMRFTSSLAFIRMAHDIKTDLTNDALSDQVVKREQVVKLYVGFHLGGTEKREQHR